MRTIFLRIIFAGFISTLVSCGGKNKRSPDQDPSTKDSLVKALNDSLTHLAADSSLSPVKDFIEKGLTTWERSFTGFSLDSFRMTQKTKFEFENAEPPTDLKNFYEMYKATLVYSPDSSHFLDLYSSNIWLEKKGKKIIAIGDPDQTVLLVNPQTKEWRPVVFFGPSAGIEEVIWTSSTSFILAGTMSNEDGKWMPILLLADINSKTLRWFESNAIRPESSKYGASGMKKLKIDEWE